MIKIIYLLPSIYFYSCHYPAHHNNPITPEGQIYHTDEYMNVLTIENPTVAD